MLSHRPHWLDNCAYSRNKLLHLVSLSAFLLLHDAHCLLSNRCQSRAFPGLDPAPWQPPSDASASVLPLLLSLSFLRREAHVRGRVRWLSKQHTFKEYREGKGRRNCFCHQVSEALCILSSRGKLLKIAFVFVKTKWHPKMFGGFK